MIWKKREAVLEKYILLESPAIMDKLFYQENFDDSAKYGFLGIAVMKIQRMATLAMYRSVTDYDMLVKAIKI